MPPLHDVLTALAGRPDAAGALVASDEGLVIDAALPPGLEPETIAALAATAAFGSHSNATGVSPRQLLEVVDFGPPVVSPDGKWRLSPTKPSHLCIWSV